MTRRLTIASLFLLLCTSLSAVTPQAWKVDTTEEFLAGEIEGFAVSARGEISPGPRLEKVTDVADPFVLSQATDGKGRSFIGTGNGGNLYSLSGKKLELIYQVPEPEIYALAYVKGRIIVGSSPNGKIYSVNPGDGAAKELFDPEEAYIWTIEPLPDGSLLVGTGLEGRIYKVGLDGSGSVFFDTNDQHVRSIAVLSSGRILAGTAGSVGRVYEITGEGVGRALHESRFSEISAIEFEESSGLAWAAAVTTVLPNTAPTRSKATQGQGGEASSQRESSGDSGGAASVDVSFSFGGTPVTPQVARVGASEIYRIEPDGFVTTAKKFDREIVYALRAAGRDSVHVATGPSGRIYRFSEDELALIGTVPEKQIVTLGESSPVMVTTTNSGAVYMMETSRPEKAEITSKAGDTGRFSRFGSFDIEGRGLENSDLRVAFRSGNTSTPDETWSTWQPPLKGIEGSINAPAARYLQWKIEAVKPADELVIDSVRCAYVNRNVPPDIENVMIHDPGVIYVSSAYPGSPQVLEATNPDEYGIFNSLSKPTNRNDPGKRLFRKGYRTLTWVVKDENGDKLRYDLEFRREGRGEWLSLRENMKETTINFDTSQLPDGRYEFRLTASDEPSNPGDGLSSVRDHLVMTVDNSAPAIEAKTSGDHIEILVVDQLSPIVKAEYSVDAKEWVQVVPREGLADSKKEAYRLTREAVDGHLVIFRVVDAQYNVATALVE